MSEVYFHDYGNSDKCIHIYADMELAKMFVSYLEQDTFNAAADKNYSDVVRNATLINQINKSIKEWEESESE